MKIGYARISTTEQNLDLQVDALKKYGCDKIFTDKLSGATQSRPGLDEAISFARAGDTIVCWRLDRLGRSLQHLLRCVDDLQTRGVGFASITEAIDTSTINGKLIFHIFAALSEFERGLIRERTISGLQAAKERGRVGGRPSKLTATQIEMAKMFFNSEIKSVSEICSTLKISRATLYRVINERRRE